MNAHLQRGLWVCGLLTLTGCGDSADSLLRTGINWKTELTDRLTKVTDEPSARKFIDHTLKVYIDKNKNLNDKWDKWIKDIEDPYRGKVRVVAITSTAAPGTEQWEKDLLAAENKKDDLVIATREAFINYMKNVAKDSDRFDREKARIKELVNSLLAEERAKGGDPPVASEKWPNLVKINEADTFRQLLLSGAQKKSAPQSQ